MFEDIDTRKLNIKNVRFGTGEWLLAHPDYQEWLHPARSMQKPGVLWISGKPGAGKSMITKFAYLSMKRGTERCPDIQLIMDDSTMLSLSYDGCHSLHVLKHLFCQAVFALGQRSFSCFIDALDECDEQEAADLMQYSDKLTKISTAAGSLFRVCVSGGDGLSMSHRFRAQIILEDQPGHVKDLESTITRTLHAGTSTLVEGLHFKLLLKAAGNFRWVVSAVEDMNTEVAQGEIYLGKVLKNAGLI
ncbi:PfsNACHT and ankyrin domain protein [Penicillium lividum]|nr:PfsNACHT and ankyrin domain protein [Penicillium lividum]